MTTTNHNAFDPDDIIKELESSKSGLSIYEYDGSYQVYDNGKRQPVVHSLDDLKKQVAELCAIDYRSLLKKYIAHIIDCEGSDYFSFRDHPFTPQELEELKRLSEEPLVKDRSSGFSYERGDEL